jgi:PAS domain S-box-containing protein
MGNGVAYSPESPDPSASNLAALVEASEDAIISKTLDGHVLTWNAAAERIYGYPAAEAKGQPMTFLLPADRRDEEAEILEKIRLGLRVEHFETVRVRRDGKEIDVSITISPIRDPSGTIIGASHIARDISERKEAETLLRDSEARLRAYLESASQGIVTVDAPGTIEIVNAKAAEIFGYDRAELVGKSLEALVPGRQRQAHAQHRSGYFDGPRSRPMGHGLDLCGLRKDGSEFPVEIALSYISSDQGTIAIAFINDITERKRIEEQFRETQKLESLGVLAGGVAHDFNNLLTGIIGNTSLAVDQLSMAHPAREPLRCALEAGERAADLIRQLLAYAGKGRYLVEPVCISTLIREICELIQSSIPRTVQLRLQLPDNLPAIDVDTNQIRQLIMNLVINGAEAIGEDRNGTVTVTTGVLDVDLDYILSRLGPKEEIVPGRYVSLEVQDTGCGMDSATVSRIFDPFFTTKFTGRGLGLAAVQGIVRSHKGALRVDSVQGKGSTFQVLFPARKPAAAGAGRFGAQPAAEAVLVIDDEQIVRQTAKSMLERYGYRVFLAENGKEGVDLFRAIADKISLVILDMTMPVMSGEETLRNLKLIQPQVRVLLSSGYNAADAVRRFAGMGLVGFVQKPYSAVHLAHSVETALLAKKREL